MENQNLIFDELASKNDIQQIEQLVANQLNATEVKASIRKHKGYNLIPLVKFLFKCDNDDYVDFIVECIVECITHDIRLTPYLNKQLVKCRIRSEVLFKCGFLGLDINNLWSIMRITCSSEELYIEGVIVANNVTLYQSMVIIPTNAHARVACAYGALDIMDHIGYSQRYLDIYLTVILTTPLVLKRLVERGFKDECEKQFNKNFVHEKHNIEGIKNAIECGLRINEENMKLITPAILALISEQV